MFIIDSVKSRMATGYNPDGSEDAVFNLGWAAPAGQMYSTVNDLMKVHMVYVCYSAAMST